MKSKSWLKVFSSILLLLTIVLALVNYIIDPFNIFRANILKTEFQQNERFLKVEHLLNSDIKYDGLMFGSSRMATTPPEFLEVYFNNYKFYNMSASSSNLYDFEKHIKYLVEIKYPVKLIYMQIDLINMSKFGRDEYDYLRKFHPYVNGENRIMFYLKYLLGIFPENIKGKILKNIKDLNPTEYNLENGTWKKPLKDNLIKKGCADYVKSEPSFYQNNKRQVVYDKMNENRKSLKNIKKLTDENNIKLVVFITPHNNNMMDIFKIDDYLAYLKDIGNILDFYDFSGYNDVTLNDCNYYEESHYIPNVGKIVANRIFGFKNNLNTNFGNFVNKENLEEHLSYMKKNIEDYDKNKE